jgi:hypothetical protein
MPSTPPGMTWAELVTSPLMVPEPPSKPPSMVTVLSAEVSEKQVKLVLPSYCV